MTKKRGKNRQVLIVFDSLLILESSRDELNFLLPFGNLRKQHGSLAKTVDHFLDKVALVGSTLCILGNS